MPLVISFYTPENEYAQWVETLRASCDRFGLEHDIARVELPEAKTWQTRCAHKGLFMLEAMKKHRRPLLWLDADSEVVAPPTLFERPPFEFACTKALGGCLRSGTVYVAPGARSLLQMTAILCKRRPDKGHERNMNLAWQATRKRYKWQMLDEGYNYVDGTRPNWSGMVFIRSNHISGSGYHGASFPVAPAGRRPVGHPGKFQTLVTSFYSDFEGTFYAKAASQLRMRCTELALEHDIRERESRPGWNANCLQKPAHVLQVLEERKRAVLWVDVDSRIHFTPWDVDSLAERCDVAAVPYEGSFRNDPPLRVRSAVLFFNYTPAGLAFVREWKRLCDNTPGDGVIADHQLLEVTWRKFESAGTCRFAHLPESYAYLRSGRAPTLVPVISIGLAKGADRRRTMDEFARRSLEQARKAVQMSEAGSLTKK